MANNRDDNGVIPGAAQRSDIYLTAEENAGKPQGMRTSIKGVRPVIASNWIPYVQKRSVGLHGMSGREKEGRKRSCFEEE